MSIGVLCLPLSGVRAEMPAGIVSNARSKCVAWAGACGIAGVHPLVADTVVARVGDRIRFRQAGENELIVAKLTAVTVDSVSFLAECSGCAPSTTSRAALVDLEVSRKARNRARETVQGFAGGLVGAGLWAVVTLFTAAAANGSITVFISGALLTPVAATVGVRGERHSNREEWYPGVLPGR